MSEEHDIRSMTKDESRFFRKLLEVQAERDHLRERITAECAKISEQGMLKGKNSFRFNLATMKTITEDWINKNMCKDVKVTNITFNSTKMHFEIAVEPKDTEGRA